MLLHVPDDRQRRRRRSKSEAERPRIINRDQVILRRQIKSLSTGEVKRHRRDLHGGERREVVARVEQRDARRSSFEIRREFHERVAKRVIGLSLEPSHGGSTVQDHSSGSRSVDGERRRRDRDLLTTDAEPSEPDVVESVDLAVTEDRRRRVSGADLHRVEIKTRRLPRVAVNEAVRERLRFDLTRHRQSSTA